MGKESIHHAFGTACHLDPIDASADHIRSVTIQRTQANGRGRDGTRRFLHVGKWSGLEFDGHVQMRNLIIWNGGRDDKGMTSIAIVALSIVAHGIVTVDRQFDVKVLKGCTVQADPF